MRVESGDSRERLYVLEESSFQLIVYVVVFVSFCFVLFFFFCG